MRSAILLLAPYCRKTAMQRVTFPSLAKTRLEILQSARYLLLDTINSTTLTAKEREHINAKQHLLYLPGRYLFLHPASTLSPHRNITAPMTFLLLQNGADSSIVHVYDTCKVTCNQRHRNMLRLKTQNGKQKPATQKQGPEDHRHNPVSPIHFISAHAVQQRTPLTLHQNDRERI